MKTLEGKMWLHELKYGVEKHILSQQNTQSQLIHHKLPRLRKISRHEEDYNPRKVDVASQISKLTIVKMALDNGLLGAIVDVHPISLDDCSQVSDDISGRLTNYSLSARTITISNANDRHIIEFCKPEYPNGPMDNSLRIIPLIELQTDQPYKY
jgi:hypothetical protein